MKRGKGFYDFFKFFFRRRQCFVFQFLGIIQYRDKPRQDGFQVALNVFHRLGQLAGHKAICGFYGVRAVGVYHIYDAFRVGQIHFPVQKRATGEFAPLRKARAFRHARRNHAFRNPCSAMHVKLHDVFAGVTFRRFEINHITEVGKVFRVDFSEVHKVRFNAAIYRFRFKNGAGNRQRVSAESDYRYAALSRGR